MIGKIEYVAYRSRITDEELGSYTTYGVRAYLCVKKHRRLVAELADMSLCREEVLGLVRRLNEKNISPFLMIREAEDMLGI